MSSEAILIYRLGSLGDTVVALPCFNKIRQAFPGHRLVVLTNFPVSSKAAPLQDILQPGGIIDEAIAYPIATRSLRQLLHVAREIRRTGARTLFYIGGGRGLWRVYRDLLFFRLCGVRKIIGAPATRGLDWGRVSDGEREPEAERLSRCLAALGPINLGDRQSWSLHLTNEEETNASEFLRPLGPRPFIAINMGGKILSKDWGEANWSQLLSSLAHLQHLGLVFVGGQEDAPRAERLSALWRGPALQACGRLTPRESAAVLKRASLFVGHDSGPLHLAASQGIRTVSMFGNNNTPRKWHPYGAGHRVLHDIRGVEFIQHADVLKAVDGVLRELDIDRAAG